MNKENYVKALRDLANYVEAREWPEKIEGWLGPQDVFDLPKLYIGARNKTEFGVLCASMGSFDKVRTDYTTGAKTTLESGVTIEVSIGREKVCRKIVVGTRTIAAVPEHTEVVEEQPEHTEEVVEWECPESFIALAKETENVG